MSTIRALLNAMLCLPEDEPLRRKAEMAVQLYKDFNFRVADGFEAEALMFKDMEEQVNDIVLSVVSFQRLHAKKFIPLPLRITGILGLGIYYLIDGIRDYKLMSFLLST